MSLSQANQRLPVSGSEAEHAMRLTSNATIGPQTGGAGPTCGDDPYSQTLALFSMVVFAILTITHTYQCGGGKVSGKYWSMEGVTRRDDRGGSDRYTLETLRHTLPASMSTQTHSWGQRWHKRL